MKNFEEISRGLSFYESVFFFKFRYKKVLWGVHCNRIIWTREKFRKGSEKHSANFKGAKSFRKKCPEKNEGAKKYHYSKNCSKVLQEYKTWRPDRVRSTFYVIQLQTHTLFFVKHVHCVYIVSWTKTKKIFQIKTKSTDEHYYTLTTEHLLIGFFIKISKKLRILEVLVDLLRFW